MRNVLYISVICYVKFIYKFEKKEISYFEIYNLINYFNLFFYKLIMIKVYFLKCNKIKF